MTNIKDQEDIPLGNERQLVRIFIIIIIIIIIVIIIIIRMKDIHEPNGEKEIEIDWPVCVTE